MRFIRRSVNFGTGAIITAATVAVGFFIVNQIAQRGAAIPVVGPPAANLAAAAERAARGQIVGG